ncbi:MAG: hypothetical protein ACKV2T_41425 [Kofleriaceae bacterium]
MRTGWIATIVLLGTACGSVTAKPDAGEGSDGSGSSGDTTPPETTLTLAPSTTGASATFTIASSEANSTFKCAVDSTILEDCEETVTITGLTTGAHVFRAAATDAAGNMDPTPVEHSFNSDGSGPTVTITSPAANSTVGTSVTLNFTTEANAVTTCQLDSQPVIQNCVSGQLFTNLTSAMAHMVTVTATDSLGNSGAPAVAMFTVDDQGPSLTFSGAPTNGSTINQTSVAITFNIVPANEPATFTYECRFTGAANFAACTNFNRTGLLDQTYMLEVRATDRFGNTGAPVTTGWTVAPMNTSIFAIRTTPLAVGTRVRVFTNVRFTAKTADRFWCQEVDGNAAQTASRGITVASTTAAGDTMMTPGRNLTVVGTIANPNGNLTLVDATYTAGTLGASYNSKSTNRDSINVLLEANEGMFVDTAGTAFRQAGACAAPNFCIRSCARATPVVESFDASGMVLIDQDHNFAGILEGTGATTYRYRVTEANDSSDACL